MSEGCRRKKQPQLVRMQLLEATARLIVEQGLAGVSLERVARRAGVSKGGLLHHYPSRQALLEGLFQALVEAFQASIDAYIAGDAASRGRFTRAYVSTVLTTRFGSVDSTHMGLCALALSGDKGIHAAWHAWLGGQLAKHGEDAADVGGRLIRFAADGLWLDQATQCAGCAPKDRQAVIERLIAMTHDM
jgi:AcrR family transcriptional regulator